MSLKKCNKNYAIRNSQKCVKKMNNLRYVPYRKKCIKKHNKNYINCKLINMHTLSRKLNNKPITNMNISIKNNIFLAQYIPLSDIQLNSHIYI